MGDQFAQIPKFDVCKKKKNNLQTGIKTSVGYS